MRKQRDRKCQREREIKMEKLVSNNALKEEIHSPVNRLATDRRLNRERERERENVTKVSEIKREG